MDRSYPGDQPVGVEGNRSPTGATKQAKVSSYKAMPPPIPKKDGLRANAWTVVKRAELNTGKYAPQPRRRRAFRHRDRHCYRHRRPNVHSVGIFYR